MRLEKAIEIKRAWRSENYPPPLADEMNADELSIQAIQRLIDCRRSLLNSPFQPLPGETREGENERP